MRDSRQDKNAKPKQPLLLVAIAMLIYLVVNGVCIFAPFIPGPEVFLGWGVVFPMAGITATWVWLCSNRETLPNWVAFAVAFTMILAAAGFATIWIVSQIWASV